MKDSIDELLNKETEIDERYALKTIKENNLLMELSLDNVKKVEAMLRYNSFYVQFNYENLKPGELFNRVKPILDNINDNRAEIRKDKKNDTKGYEFSSTIYIKVFKYLYENNMLGDYYKTLIYIILRKVNSENRTRVSLNDIEKISENIANIKVIDFIELLKEPANNKGKNCNYELIRIIGDNNYDKRYFSFATKFCHFFAFYFFDDGKYRDGFSIYDQVVKDNLKYYYDYYVKNDPDNLINKPYDGENKDIPLVEIYNNYQHIIDKILDSIPSKISRNGFDHIVWYTKK